MFVHLRQRWGDYLAFKRRLKQQSTWKYAVVEIIDTLLVALVVAFTIKTFIIQVSVVPTGSMIPTLIGGVPGKSNDRLLVNKFIYDFSAPKRGDIVVFKSPTNDGKDYVIKFQKMVKECNLSDDQYIIRDRSLPEEENFGIALSNRSGMMENADYKIPSLKNPLKNPCYIPSYTLFFDYLGDVLMCPHDWGKKIILGNLKNDKLVDIWFSNRAMTIRKNLNKSNRNFSPCNVCDVEGTLLGEKNSLLFR